jgi:hypothetical protein
VKQSLVEQRTKLAAAEIPQTVDPTLAQSLQQAVAESFVSGFRRVMLVAMVLALLSGLSAWLLIEGKPSNGEK